MFALSKPGELSPFLRTREGLVLVRLMERQSASTRPLSEFKDAQREQAFHAAMKAGLQIDINQPLLNSLTRPLPPESQPPSLPGTKSTALVPNP